MKIALYLYFNGNCEDAMEYYKEVFDGKEELKYLYSKDMTNDQKLIGKVFHAELDLGGFYLYMADVLDQDLQDRQYKLVFETFDASEADSVFAKLSFDGKIISEITQMTFGPKIGALVDKYGTTWNVVIVDS